MAASFPVDPDVVWATLAFFTSFFTLLAVWFPLRLQGNWKSPPGEIWAHLRAMIFPFLAAAMWYQLAALSVVAGYDATSGASLGNGLSVFYFFCWGMFWLFIVVGLGLVVTLALKPIADALDGRESL
ncbi:MAG: hypothetical protein JRN50_02210 [Nitrososphaerota archaeon]|nr:hypothetical protein [Nitrososphaerota archaeon]